MWALLGGEGGEALADCSTGALHGRDRARRARGGVPRGEVEPHPTWTLDFAARFARRLEDFGVAWLEEPLNRGDVCGLAALRRETRTPIAGGELNGSLVEYLALLDADALDIYQPDATLAEGSYGGELSASFWILREALARGRRFTPHTWTNGFGFGVNLQVAGAVPRDARLLLEFPHEPPFAGANFSRFLKKKWTVDREGRIKIPDEPGLGMEVDWDVVRRFGRRVFRGDERSIALRALVERKLSVALELRAALAARPRAELAPADFRVPELPFGLSASRSRS